MRLTRQDTITALDAEFGRMALQIGQHAWGLTALTMREKAFVFVAADLCAHDTGFALRTHVSMARSQGVSWAGLHEAVRHLAPYVGYPVAAEALMVMGEVENAEPDDEPHEDEAPAPSDQMSVERSTVEELRALDPDFAEFVVEQMTQRWNRAGLTARERALCTVATDVCRGTLDASFRVHVALAREHGAGDEQIRAVLLLAAEFGVAMAWRAYAALPQQRLE